MPWTAGPTAIALVLAIAVAAALAFGPSVAALDCEGVALDEGCLFTITGGDTDDPNDGYAVTNADEIPLWDFVRERDLQAIGYPISQRWVRGPFTFQAFQKVILQWDPGKARMNYYNTLDVLANRYPWVELPNVPAHQVLEADRGADFATITRNHLALLEQNAAIKARFLSEPDWLNLYGLPISYEEREVNGNPQGLQMLRAQRTVFVIWNVPAPGTTVGRVNLQNVPDKVKRLSNVIIPDAAKAPIPPEDIGSPPIEAIPTVGELAQQSTFLQGILRSMPWLANHTLPWVADGLQGGESGLLSRLQAIARDNLRLARFIADADWFANFRDYATPHSPNPRYEDFIMQQLHRLSKQSPELFDTVLAYSWFADDLKFYERLIISFLPIWFEDDAALTSLVASAPWIADGPTRNEFIAVESLFYLNRTHPELTGELFFYTLEPPLSDVNYRMISRIQEMAQERPDLWQKVVNQPWYADGLSFEERALIHALSPHLPDLDSLLATPFTQSRTVSLPFTGDVHLWAFQAEPFPAGEDVLRMVSEALLSVEQLMQFPFPTDSFTVRFRVIHDPELPSGYQTSQSESTIFVNRYNNASLSRNWPRFRRTIYSLTADSYFNLLGPAISDPEGRTGARWIKDGGKSFVASYVDDVVGNQDLKSRLDQVSLIAQHDCMDQGIPDLHQLTIPLTAEQVSRADHPDRVRWRHCLDVLSEYLLLRLYVDMGEAGFSAALREIYLIRHEVDLERGEAGISYPTDIQAFQTFLRHASPDRKDAVRDAFREIHGPFTADPSFRV